jgi:hypothetical protein
MGKSIGVPSIYGCYSGFTHWKWWFSIGKLLQWFGHHLTLHCPKIHSTDPTTPIPNWAN